MSSSHVYVGYSGDNEIRKLNALTGSHVWAYHVHTTRVEHLRLDLDYLYSASAGASGQVKKIFPGNPAGPSTVWTFNAPRPVAALDVAPDGNVYAASWGTDTIPAAVHKINSSGSEVWAYNAFNVVGDGSRDRITDLRVDADGYIYVAVAPVEETTTLNLAGEIRKLNPSGGLEWTYSDFVFNDGVNDIRERPFRLALDGDQNIFISISYAEHYQATGQTWGSIRKISPTRDTIWQWGGSGSTDVGRAGEHKIAVGPFMCFLAIGSTIVRLDPGVGTEEWRGSTSFGSSETFHIVCDPDEDIYTNISGSTFGDAIGRIERLSGEDASRIWLFDALGSQHPYGLCVSPLDGTFPEFWAVQPRNLTLTPSASSVLAEWESNMGEYVVERQRYTEPGNPPGHSI